MAQHLVAVCVVCLLCAEHLPCKQHFNENVKDTKRLQQEQHVDGDQFYHNMEISNRLLNNDNNNKLELVNIPAHKRRGRTKGVIDNLNSNNNIYNKNNVDNNNNNNNNDADEGKSNENLKNIFSNSNYNNNNDYSSNDHNLIKNDEYTTTIRDRKMLIRKKRHSTNLNQSKITTNNINNNNNNNNNNIDDKFTDIKIESNNERIKDDVKLFIKKIFTQFGDGNKLIMNITGFEEMLKHLNLYRLIQNDVEENNSNYSITPQRQTSDNANETCISSIDLITRISSHSVPTTTPSQLSSSPSLSSSSSSSSTSSISPASPLHINYNNSNNNSSNLIVNNLLLNNNSTNSSDTKLSVSYINKTTTTNNNTQSTKTAIINSLKENLFVNSYDLIAICPILLYQMTAPTSLERSGCITNNLLMMVDNNYYNNNSDVDNFYSTHYQKQYSNHQHHHHHQHVHHSHNHNNYSGENNENRTLVWVYATLSILGTSLCGLLGVAVIPCMDKHYYNHILQFLVALAVGTLTGDALLHLLPHAMIISSETMNIHTNMTLKGFVAVLGIIFFFMTERGLTMIAEWYKGKQKKEKPSSCVRVMRDPETVSLKKQTIGEKLCKHKYSSYPYCYDEIAMDTKDDHHHHNKHEDHLDQQQQQQQPQQSFHQHQHGDHINENGSNNLLETPKHLKSTFTNKDDEHIPNETEAFNTLGLTNENGNEQQQQQQQQLQQQQQQQQHNHHHHNHHHHDNNNRDNDDEDKINCVQENYTIILREHESKHHGHSHTHGHVHSPPSSLSAVAWMVIMGDGLHNFTDGMAIGAAFSNNIAGGFSTAIAVFCHELPHELGDFAVLLKAGMSAKQAVYYNLLSSVLSFFGTIIGILIGDTPEASAWIFACAAGLFIYIALVDMMPELTSTHKEKCAISQCLLQFLGMCIGLCIMLVIALFEHDLKQIFSSDHS